MIPAHSESGAASHKEAAPSLLCTVLSRQGLPLARRLASGLSTTPWCAPQGGAVAHCRVCAPARFAEEGVLPFEDLSAFLAGEYHRHAGHIFIGATGIAVRVLAPLLRHKSQDPPALVLDPAGRFVISLLSGHWGGGNDLTRHLARLLEATAVITTASDQDASAPPALDLLIRDAGLRILDWEQLPRAQAALLEGQCLHLWDPYRALPAAQPPNFERLGQDMPPPRSQPHVDAPPLLAVHWQRLSPAPGLLRLALPRLYVGLGCRQNIPREAALSALTEIFAAQNLEPGAVVALATVLEKKDEPALCEAATRLAVPLRTFAAADLAQCATPHPSEAAGRRFQQPPFSVCEASALLAAQADGFNARLLLPKTVVQKRLTLAVALAAPCGALHTTSTPHTI